MIIVYIIIGYLLVTSIALIFDIATNILTMSKSAIEKCETIKDFLDETLDDTYLIVFIPIINIPYCISSVVVFLFMLFYKLYYYINAHWDKFLNIRICKKKKNKSKRSIMKKSVLVICALLCANVLFAQENVKKEKDLSVVVDSLSAKLNKLQKDYDYLWCEYKLNDFNHSLQLESNSILIKTNQIQFDIYHGRFYYDLYNAYKANYNATIENLDAFKKKAEEIKFLVKLKMFNSNFSEYELRVLQHRLELIDYVINLIETNLKLYDGYLKEYRNK